MSVTPLPTQDALLRRETLDEPRQDTVEPEGSPHAVERHVRRVLTTQPGLNVSGLVVHRMPDGVCLTGVIDSLDDETDVCRLVRQATGLNQVINRLLVRSSGND